MTTVTFYKEGYDIIGFEVDGHSGYAPIGYDIICAGISALSQATIIGLVEVSKTDIKKEERDGYLKVVLADLRYEPHEEQILLRTMELAIKDLANQYQNFIKVCTKQIEVI